MKKITAILLCTFFALSLAGCGAKTDTSTTAPTGQTTAATTANATAGQTTEPAVTGTMINGELVDENGYINRVLNAEPTVLDVARFSVLVDRNVMFNIYEPLIRIEGGKVTGGGAESWDISDDGLEYIFHLRENYWSDGQRVTAGDYLLSFQRQASPDNVFAFINNISEILNIMEVNAGEKDMSELGVEALDDNTLKITLSSPNVEFLTAEDFMPCRADLVEQHGDQYGTEANTILSCGPFVLTEWLHSSKLSFVKNEHYWDKDNVHLQAFYYHIISDLGAQFAAFENGTLDFIFLSDTDYIEKLRTNPTLSEEVYKAGRTSMVAFNTENIYFSNQKIRQAFNLAIDRDSIANILYSGLSTPAYGLVPDLCSVGSANYRENVPEPLLELKAQYPDPKALLIEGMLEAGLGDDPSTITVEYCVGSTAASTKIIAEFYQQMWQTALGVTVNLALNESATHFGNMADGNFDFGFISWGSGIEPAFQISRWINGDDTRWSNEEFKALVAKAAITTDEKERLELYAKAERILLIESPCAPIFYTGSLRFGHSYVRGFDANSFDNTGMKTFYTVGR